MSTTIHDCMLKYLLLIKIIKGPDDPFLLYTSYHLNYYDLVFAAYSFLYLPHLSFPH